MLEGFAMLLILAACFICLVWMGLFNDLIEKEIKYIKIRKKWKE